MVSLPQRLEEREREDKASAFIRCDPGLTSRCQRQHIDQDEEEQATDIELLSQAITALTGVILRQVEVIEENAERRERERELRMLLNELQKSGKAAD
jgi:hypothetical protein